MDTKTKELSVVTEEIRALHNELQTAKETIARLEQEAVANVKDEFRVCIRPENAYDDFVEQAMRNMGTLKELLVRQ